MPVLQALVVLVAVVLIVWWALRRSSKESAREAPAGHAHEEPAEVEAHEEPVRFEAANLPAVEEPAPADALVAVPGVVVEPEPVVEVVEPAAVIEERLPEPVEIVEPVVEVKPDDLIIIEGIGPRISGILKSHGVKTFAQVAGMQPEEIKAILVSVDERLGRISDPTTWPEQAALAAKGDLEGLQKLQDSLKAGRVAK